MPIGFIGLGMMGAGMASNLQKAGHKLVVHDLSRQAASHHLADGRRLGRQPARGRRGVRRRVHLAARRRPTWRRWALGEDGLVSRLPQGCRVVRPVHQLGQPGARAAREARRAGRGVARCAGQRRSARRELRASWRSGSAATRRCSTSTSRCSTRWATRRATSVRSAPARSPSWCTICRVPRPTSRWPRCSPWA